MKTKFSGILTLLLALVVQITFAQEQQTVTGTVTDDSGMPLPGVNVLIKGTTRGVQTDFDGNYSIEASTGEVLVFSYLGMKTTEFTFQTVPTIDVVMTPDAAQLEEVVVTALGIKREAKTLTYASQEVTSEKLNITQDANIKSALAGKIAGVQLNGQAGSKLGQAGKIRIRGAISLTSDNDALYVVDGIPGADPNSIDMENVATINVLKGPNATALYGQRADSGVVVITTKKGSGKLAVELSSSITLDKVAYLPNYQNKYGGGYEGEDSWSTFGDELPMDVYPDYWQRFEGQRYIAWDNNYADESWGPAFDGEDYIPWYAFWPDSPYYGQTAKYEAQPDNIKDFYNTGVTLKNNVAVSGGNEKFNARLSYTNLNQEGITPYTELQKHFINTTAEFNATEKLKINTNINFTTADISGDYSDGYGNQTSGSFNSWFSRGIDVDKLRELKDLETPGGYSASWNWWGPDYYAYFGGGFQKPAFWFNPYTFLERYKQERESNTVIGSLTATYAFTDNWELSATASRNQENYSYRFEFPNSLAFSAAPGLYNAWINSFGIYKRATFENNFNALLKYENDFGDIDLSAFVGGNIRKNGYDRFSAQMDPGANSGGLIIPDLYDFANAGEVPTPSSYIWDKQVNSIYAKASIGYRGFLYLDGTYRKDWSSALPEDNNGYGYPSLGTSFIFSELVDTEFMTFGKFRAGWAQVGSDMDALLLNPIYPIGSKPFMGTTVLQNTPATVVDPALKPALNTSFEVGLDFRFFNNRLGLSGTYYDETREDEIISISVPRGSGYDAYLTNAGESQRKGIELSLDGDIFQDPDGFSWNVLVNYAQNETTVNALPNGLNATEAPGGGSAFGVVSMIHELGNNWGQLRGTGIKRIDGEPVLQSNGLYAVEQNKYLGSVLPDFTGGLVNTFRYKNLSLTAAIDFQKGGKFFSLSEYWGQYSGLLEETAATNDRGSNVRDAIADGGGVHVTGVDADGNAVDMYADAYSYFTQGRANNIAELFIHDASYIKLRDVSLTYTMPASMVNDLFQSASISLVGRNLALLAVSDDNDHKWDPSELSQTYGEDGQVPGTRSYGLNLKLTF